MIEPEAFTHIGAIVGDIMKEGHRREELRPRLEVERGYPVSDDEFLPIADRTGMRMS